MVGANGNGAAAGLGLNGENSKVGDFLYYSDSDDEDFEINGLGTQVTGEQLSCNFVDYLSAREFGLSGVGGGRFFPEKLSTEYGTRHMLANAMMKETSVLMPNMDKIFCSKWLSHRQVVFGTKCSKVCLFYMYSWPKTRENDRNSTKFREIDIVYDFISYFWPTGLFIVIISFKKLILPLS